VILISKILVVDDDRAILRLYKLILEEIGFDTVECADNGREAIKRFKGNDKKPDLVIMDYRMPIMNGIDAMLRISEIEKSVKFIFASADDSVKESALSKGASAFLKKPFDIDKLHKLIINTLPQGNEDIKMMI
jgi:CheY-like chemotaxis protein